MDYETADALLTHFQRIADALERIDRNVSRLASPSSAEPGEPAAIKPDAFWCSAITKHGKRCLRDAAADGLCTTHWRLSNRSNQPSAVTPRRYGTTGRTTMPQEAHRTPCDNIDLNMTAAELAMTIEALLVYAAVCEMKDCEVLYETDLDALLERLQHALFGAPTPPSDDTFGNGPPDTHSED